MEIFALNVQQTVPRPRERVFPFFARPENLALITPKALDFRLLTPTPVRMEQGRVIDYTIRLLGLRVRWRSMITTYEPPERFVDEQIMGPYSFWHHTHTFEAEGERTHIRDEVRYALPAGMPGFLTRVLQARYVRPQLEHIFAFRRTVIGNMFGDHGPDPVPTGDAPAGAGRERKP